MSIVEISGVTKNYRMGDVEVEALKEVDLEIGPGALVCLVGPSGSGKTTLLNLIGCLDKPSEGRVRVAGTDTATLNRRQAAIFRGEHLGFVFQDFNLIPVLSAAENVEYPLLMVNRISDVDRREAVTRLLDEVGIIEQAGKRPGQLSGGQKQRVAIARALITRPKLVLADEPTANLDEATAHMIIGLMKDMRDKLGTTFIFSTHDARIVGQAEQIFTIRDGRLTPGRETGGGTEGVCCD